MADGQGIGKGRKKGRDSCPCHAFPELGKVLFMGVGGGRRPKAAALPATLPCCHAARYLVPVREPARTDMVYLVVVVLAVTPWYAPIVLVIQTRISRVPKHIV